MNRKEIVKWAVICLVCGIVILFVLCQVTARACTADVGTATTEVFVRNEDGSIAGSLTKGDMVAIVGTLKDGWKKVLIGGKAYKVYGAYLDVEEGVCLDEVKVREKVRKSKTKENGGVYEKQKCKIKGSVFEEYKYW